MPTVKDLSSLWPAFSPPDFYEASDYFLRLDVHRIRVHPLAFAKRLPAQCSSVGRGKRPHLLGRPGCPIAAFFRSPPHYPTCPKKSHSPSSVPAVLRGASWRFPSWLSFRHSTSDHLEQIVSSSSLVFFRFGHTEWTPPKPRRPSPIQNTRKRTFCFPVLSEKLFRCPGMSPQPLLFGWINVFTSIVLISHFSSLTRGFYIDPPSSFIYCLTKVPCSLACRFAWNAPPLSERSFTSVYLPNWLLFCSFSRVIPILIPPVFCC